MSFGCHQPLSASTLALHAPKVYVARMQDEAAANPTGFQDCWIGWIEWGLHGYRTRSLVFFFLLLDFILIFFTSHRSSVQLI